MDLIEWLIKKPCFIIPLLSFLIGLFMLVFAPTSYMIRTKKIIITPKTIMEDYTDRERKLVFYGMGLGFIGIVGLFIVEFIYGSG